MPPSRLCYIIYDTGSLKKRLRSSKGKIMSQIFGNRFYSIISKSVTPDLRKASKIFIRGILKQLQLHTDYVNTNS